MQRIIWIIGNTLERFGRWMQKASGWKSKRKRKGTGNPPGRPRKRQPATGEPLPFEA